MKLRFGTEKWPLKRPFRITGYTMTETEVVVVTLDREGVTGRGEAEGVYYLKDDVPGILKRLEEIKPRIEAGIDRSTLQTLLPAGGTRNALDCALWELEAKIAGKAAWQLAGLPAPKPLLTAHTVGADTPQAMADGARGFQHAKLVKLKLTGEAEDAARVREVRAARPDVDLVVDANQGFTPQSLHALIPVLLEARVSLIEQPFRVGQEALMDGLESPIPVAADESAQTLRDVATLPGRFDVVNIKLDKCGGLTEGLAIAREARRLGLGVMVGNMTGTSLAMAPGFLVGQLCQVVDLDGPVLLQRDRSPAASYTDGLIWCAESVWGGTSGLR